MKNTQDNIIDRLPKYLFWDINIESLDQNKHRRFIIERVFERGSMQDLYLLISFYGKDQVINELIHSTSMKESSIRLASLLFDISAHKFKQHAIHQINK